jgi:hypothetical protein
MQTRPWVAWLSAASRPRKRAPPRAPFPGWHPPCRSSTSSSTAAASLSHARRGSRGRGELSLNRDRGAKVAPRDRLRNEWLLLARHVLGRPAIANHLWLLALASHPSTRGCDARGRDVFDGDEDAGVAVEIGCSSGDLHIGSATETHITRHGPRGRDERPRCDTCEGPADNHWDVSSIPGRCEER